MNNVLSIWILCVIGGTGSNICGHWGAWVRQGGWQLLTFSGTKGGRVVEIDYLGAGINLLNQLPYVGAVFLFNRG